MEFRKAPRSVRIEGNNKIQFRGHIETHTSEYKKLRITLSDAFCAQWIDIEEQAKSYAESEWVSQISDGSIRVSYDEHSMFFDENRTLIEEPNIITGQECIVIIELNSVYSWKGKNGITCRVHQMMLLTPQCVL